VTLDELRRYAVARSLFPPTTLARALLRLGFVQADPIRAPARAQDLTLRHRVKRYRAGDLERRYPDLQVEEDFFVNYGFVARPLYELMHPRARTSRWTATVRRRARALMEFVHERGTVHPREADGHFAHGTVTNYWGGSSNATTHLLDALHYRGWLRVARRQDGIRLYAPRPATAPPVDPAARRARVDALVDVVVNLYAPLPGATLSMLVGRLRHAAPQWRGELKAALSRARRRLAHATAEGVEWYWPVGEKLVQDPPEAVRLLAPFDPVVWDRRRFERLWRWAYRFEAYTPVARRKLGYYALPLLWREHVIGWANVTAAGGRLVADFGYVAGRPPRERAFRDALEAEMEDMRAFLGLSPEGD
jgi:uncharacterized protein YcaQ